MAAGRCNLFLSFVLTTMLLAVPLARGQDKIVTNDDVYTGKIIGATSDGSPRLRLEGGSETKIPKNKVRFIEMAPPSGFAAARQSFLSGKWKETLEKIAPIAQDFGGLDLPWAMESLLLRGGAEMELEDWSAAQKTAETLSRLYAKTALAQWETIVKARVLLATRTPSSAAAASRSLLPLLGQMQKEIVPLSPATSFLTGELHYAMGLCLEAQSNFNEALFHYLAVAVIQPGTSAWEPHARRHADQLSTQNAAFVP
jgi:hypothetical protein